MSLNWVMLPDSTTTPSSQSQFIPLPSERTIFRSAPRVSLNLTTPKSNYPAHTPSPAVNLSSSDGTLHLTNQRIIYLPAAKSSISSNVSSTLKSFSCPLLNLHDTHLTLPWFGPNSWTAVVQPVVGGGLPTGAGSSGGGLELKFTFKEGGAPEFQGKFEAIKERLVQVREASEGGRVDLANVNLDQLPRYEDSGADRRAPEGSLGEDGDQVPVPVNATSEQVRAMAAAAAQQREQQQIRRSSRVEQEALETPRDAPPGYEEVQVSGVQTELETRLAEEQNTWREPGTRAPA